MPLPDPTFPPLLTGHAVKAPLEPFETACRQAQERTLGAGDIVWSRAIDSIDLAIVMEPDVPADKALQMVPLAKVAVGDSLGALAPPQVAITFRWPDKIFVNGGEIGRIRAALEPADEDGAPPNWLVIGWSLRLRHGGRAFEPGEKPLITALVEEGCEKLTRTIIVQSLCRHFMTWLNIWTDEGFKPVHDAYLFRLDGRDEIVEVNTGASVRSGMVVGLDEDANLLLKSRSGKVEMLPLGAMVEVCTGGP